jgi:acyl-CoA synthetase (AMP-forming)/AMP-acid ligase II
MTSVVDLLRRRAEQQPDRLAYGFVPEDEIEDALTYSQLAESAAGVAQALLRRRLAGQPVVLACSSGLDFVRLFFGCLCARVLAVPANVPRRSESLGRLESIMANSGAKAVICSGETQDRFADIVSNASPLRRAAWIDVAELLHAEGAANLMSIDSEAPAFLQYTSGSTATPRGVVVTHANLMHNLRLIARNFGHTEGSRGVIWLPLHHDMGLIGGVLEPLYFGGACYLMPPQAATAEPYRWLRAISRFRATTSGGPNFAYDLCVERIPSHLRKTLDLSSWEVAFCGAEPVRSETLQRFAETFAECGFREEAFYPCYGLAESTLMVTGGDRRRAPKVVSIRRSSLQQNRVAPADPGDELTLVCCGRPDLDQEVVIVNPDTRRRCRDDQIGEIWVKGPSVARGYWRSPPATEATFGGRLADTGEGPYLRTGDLGFFHNGELAVVGRRKEVIIVRGRNHYPQDIEHTVRGSHPLLQHGCCAAFAVEVEGEDRLVLVQEARRSRLADTDALVASVRRAVANEHDLDLYALAFVKPGGVLRTTSGKIQRQACRAAYQEGRLPVFHEWKARPRRERVARPLSRDELLAAPPASRERRLQAHFRELLAIALDADIDAVDLDEPLNSLGLDSLRCLEFKHRFETELEVRLPIDVLMGGVSARQLCRILLEDVEQERPPREQFLADLVAHVQSLSEADLMLLLEQNNAR